MADPASASDQLLADESILEEPGAKEPRIAAFPVVGIGASAGGLEAFRLMLEHLPADTGMAFVFVQHLSPQHSSMLASILQRSTAMMVAEVGPDTKVQPNHVYVIPPNTLMRIADSALALEARPDERGAPRPIDYFFRSLAEDRQAQAIGVLLSGADSDGSLGLEAIREEGGIAIVQDLDSAKSQEMPRFAIAAGSADLVLTPEAIGAELGRIARNPLLAGAPKAVRGKAADAIAESPDVLTRLLQVLRRTTGVDFSGYKSGTLHRRIARRMLLARHENLESYLASVESNRAELRALSEDILVHVTSFFRDPEEFDALENLILPRLIGKEHLRGASENSAFRVWVPGCSSGQEVYSIAMCLLETIGTLGASIPIHIFGTDLSEQCVTAARNAVYSETEILRLSPERQARFFVRVDGGFQIVKSVREMCVFARQNLLADPPFSRLNLVSCRNVLIYLGPAMQRHVIATFHYALQPGGCLWLGHSESLREFPELFSQIEKPHKFYLRNEGSDFPGSRPNPRRVDTLVTTALSPPDRPRNTEAEIEKTAERLVLAEFAPAWVIVNRNFEIVNSRGDVGPWLQLPSGRASLSLLRMARDEIRAELTRLLARARAGEPQVWSNPLRREAGGAINRSRLEVRRLAPLSAPTPALGDNPDASYLIVFFPPGREAEPPGLSEPLPGEVPADGVAVSPPEVDGLRQELNLSNQRLQSILSERDTANQELTSANEEIQSSNEELQSINEELETSKEELQSSNEELNTVNEELQNRNQQLVRLSDDLANLLSSTAMPILMLDNDLRIRRITQAAERVFNIRQIDVGRPLSDIRLRLSEENLDGVVGRVIETLVGEELELQDRDGRWHMLRVRPYRTAENRIEGAVLVMIDIDQIRRAQHAADTARAFSESLLQAVQTPLLVLNPDLRVRIANRAFLSAWKLNQSEVEGRPLTSLGGGHWVSPALEAALGHIAHSEKPFEDLECEHEVPGGGKRILLIHARQVHAEDGLPADAPGGDFRILLAAADITAQRRAEKIMLDELSRTETALSGSQDALQRSREELRALTASLLNAQEEERRRVSRELHDDVGQSMAKLQFDIERLEQSLPLQRKKEKKSLLTIRDTAAHLSNDLRRIAYALHPSSLDHLGLTVALRAFAREFTKRAGIRTKLSTSGVPDSVPPEIANCFYRITQEALRNVAKHAPGATLVSIHLTGDAAQLNLAIQDDGPGFDPEAVRGNGGLGLIGIEERARLIHGNFKLTVGKDTGTLITVSAPLT